jgi:hypothetical protein
VIPSACQRLDPTGRLLGDPDMPETDCLLHIDSHSFSFIKQELRLNASVGGATLGSAGGAMATGAKRTVGPLGAFGGAVLGAVNVAPGKAKIAASSVNAW